MFIKTSAHPAYAESPQHQLEQYHTDPGECIHSFTEDLPQEKWKSQNHSDIGNPESALTQYCVNRIYQKLSNTHSDTHTHTHTHTLKHIHTHTHLHTHSHTNTQTHSHL